MKTLSDNINKWEIVPKDILDANKVKIFLEEIIEELGLHAWQIDKLKDKAGDKLI